MIAHIVVVIVAALFFPWWLAALVFLTSIPTSIWPLGLAGMILLDVSALAQMLPYASLCFVVLGVAARYVEERIIAT